MCAPRGVGLPGGLDVGVRTGVGLNNLRRENGQSFIILERLYDLGSPGRDCSAGPRSPVTTSCHSGTVNNFASYVGVGNRTAKERGSAVPVHRPHGVSGSS